MKHSELAPSSAHIWASENGCRGYVQMMRKVEPAPESAEAAEGTLAHEIAAKAFIGVEAQNVEKEMIEHVKVYVDYFKNFANKSSEWDIEQHLDLWVIHDDCFGTVDAWARIGDTIHIFDFKYGFDTVEAYKNLQGIMYACGLTHADIRCEWVEIHIVQPRAPHPDGRIRSWKLNRNDLKKEILKISQAAEEALSSKAKTNPGSHCKNCDARAVCRSLGNAAIASAEFALSPAIYNLPPESLSRELDLLYEAQAHIKYRLKALETEAENKIKAGQLVPGYEVKATAGRGSHWTVEDAQIVKLGELLGLKLTKTTPLTPNQARAAGAPKEYIDQISQKNKGALKLAKININKIKEKLGV